MDRADQTRQRMKRAEDVLLPGFYQCLTTQLNVTTYRAGAAARFVCVTRMPEENVEVRRDFIDVGEYGAIQSAAIAAVEYHIKEVNYLMLNGKGI